MRLLTTILFVFLGTSSFGQLAFKKLNRDFLWDAFADGDTLFHKMLVRTIQVSPGQSRKAVVYYPEDYLLNPTKRYPFMLWNHGSGESGSGQPGLANLDNGDGLPEEFSSGRYTDMKFINPVDGLEYEFILMCPQNQTTGFAIAASQMLYMWNNDAELKARVDTNNVFLSGYSLGGQATSRHLAEQEASLYLKYYRALFFFSSPRQSGYGDIWDYTTARILKTPVREYMGLLETAGRIAFAREIRDSLNIVNPGQVTLVEVNGGHAGWQQARLQRSHRIDGMNWGEWFLSKMVKPGRPASKTILTKKAGAKVSVVKD